MVRIALASLGAMAVTLALQLSALSLLAQMQNGLLVVAGSVLAFLVPWPVAWLTLRRGAVPGIVATGLVALVLAWAGGPLVGGFYLVQFGIGSVAVSLMLRSGRSWDQAVGAGAGISVSGLACGLCVAAAMQGGASPGHDGQLGARRSRACRGGTANQWYGA